MAYGVRAELRHDQRQHVVGVASVRDSPGFEAFPGQASSEAGAAWGGTEPHREVVPGEEGLAGAGETFREWLLARHAFTMTLGGVA